MTLITAGYPGTVDKIEWAEMGGFFTYSALRGLNLSPVVGQDRTVRVEFDRAFAVGILTRMVEPENVSLPANGSSNPRRDRIILRHDWVNDETIITSKQGTPSSNPQWPNLVTNEGVLWEQSLGRVTVGPGQGQLAPGDILQSGIPQNSPVVALDDDTGLPFAFSRALVITPSTGRMRVSDGSQYHEITPGNVDWTPQTPTNAWAQRGNALFHRARRNGIVTVRGILRRQTDNWIADSHMATMPVGWRPQFQCVTIGTQISFGEQLMRRVAFHPNGQVIVRATSEAPIRGSEFFFTISYPVF